MTPYCNCERRRSFRGLLLCYSDTKSSSCWLTPSSSGSPRCIDWKSYCLSSTCLLRYWAEAFLWITIPSFSLRIRRIRIGLLWIYATAQLLFALSRCASCGWGRDWLSWGLLLAFVWVCSVKSRCVSPCSRLPFNFGFDRVISECFPIAYQLKILSFCLT